MGGSVRSTPSPAGAPIGNNATQAAAATAKKVIDIVDLSDEEEDQRNKYETLITFT